LDAGRGCGAGLEQDLIIPLIKLIHLDKANVHASMKRLGDRDERTQPNVKLSGLNLGDAALVRIGAFSQILLGEA
jgi:hypothetical protein